MRKAFALLLIPELTFSWSISRLCRQKVRCHNGWLLNQGSRGHHLSRILLLTHASRRGGWGCRSGSGCSAANSPGLAAAMFSKPSEQLQLLIDGVTDYAIYMLDPTGVVVSWNHGAERIKGYSAEEILGQHFSHFFTEDDRKAGLPSRILNEAGASGRYEGEGVRVRKNGSRFHAHAVVNSLHNRQGELVGFAKITRDITERVEAQENLRRTQEQLVQSQKMELLGQLTGGMAHDINNMLAIIMSAFQLCDRAIERGEIDKAREFIADGFDGAQRAGELVRRLLAFARQQPLSPKPLHANALVGNMSEILRPRSTPTFNLKRSWRAGFRNIHARPEPTREWLTQPWTECCSPCPTVELPSRHPTRIFD